MRCVNVLRLCALAGSSKKPKLCESHHGTLLIESLSYSLNGSPLAGPCVCLGLACQQTTGPRPAYRTAKGAAALVRACGFGQEAKVVKWRFNIGEREEGGKLEVLGGVGGLGGNRWIPTAFHVSASVSLPPTYLFCLSQRVCVPSFFVCGPTACVLSQTCFHTDADFASH